MQKRRANPTNVTSDVAMQHAAAAASRAMQHAAAAASRAMQSSQRSSQESRASYDRLGGPSSVAVPRRRPGSSLRHTETDASIHIEDSSVFSAPCVSKVTAKASLASSRPDDPAALPPITEFNGLDGRDSSVPSSYRRLRKAKSMFSTRPRTSQTPYGVPPLPSGDPLDPERSPGFQLPRTMRPSMSFIRGQYKSQSGINMNAHDAAVELARNQFTQESCDPAIRHRRSSFLLRRKREHRPFRKSFRATSDGISPLVESASGRARSTSRSFSNSIKNRLKRVFGFSKATEQRPTLHSGAEDVDIPASLNPNGSEAEYCNTSISFRDMTRSPSHDSLCISKSRVTSWADSTIANTVTTRKPGHRQSLSMIREDGISNQRMPFTPVRNDSEQAPSDLRPSPHPIGIVDSQDLYYALMAQMGRPLPDPNEGVVFGSVAKHRAIPEHVSNAFSPYAQSPNAQRQTLRHIPSNESSSPGSFATAQNRSAFVPDEHSDDGNSVIVARYGSKRDVISPSIYSRTTGGNTPVKADTADIIDTGLYDEPGTATIFAPQRTVYTSPKRAARELSSRLRANASGDWQQWISSQVDKIEQAGPTREHVREDAQFQAEDEDLANMAADATLVINTPPPPIKSSISESDETTARGTAVQVRLPSQSNFSRPFGQVSGIQPILPLQPKKSENSIQKLSVDPVQDSIVQLGENISPKPVHFIPPQGLSPIRLRSGNMQLPESPTPKRMGARRSLTKEQQRRYSARRAPLSQEGRGRTNQFRSMRTQRDFHAHDENLRQEEEYNEMMESYHQLQDVHSTISSKRMVDLFLDSRRRQMGESNGEKNSTGAFL
ncbi:hypothetical protein N7541_008153 [Penicillium brevicompactum]|uniref:Uncharacterized protein n=1 Tax=Penicillium brevicompactum TaxID=5074 RepID=A0A9W9UPX8_PENBR|nr:hypothetical protein N7541_008153 [Penicillium brevicompactum]